MKRINKILGVIEYENSYYYGDKKSSSKKFFM